MLKYIRGDLMFKKFKKNKNTWEDTPTHIYKENPDIFKDVTRQVLFDGAFDLPVQFRYFQVEEGGYSSLEHHEHSHFVMIYKGKGHVLLENEVHEVEEGDILTINSWQWHQFRADKGTLLGFLCMVNIERDRPSYPTEKELEDLRSNKNVPEFLDGKLQKK